MWHPPNHEHLTIELDNGVADILEKSARREHKAVARWAAERLQLAAMEETACANGYPAGWLKLFGAVADEDEFNAPDRGMARGVDGTNLD